MTTTQRYCTERSSGRYCGYNSNRPENDRLSGRGAVSPSSGSSSRQTPCYSSNSGSFERRGSSSNSGSFERRGSSSNSGSFERRGSSSNSGSFERRYSQSHDTDGLDDIPEGWRRRDYESESYHRNASASTRSFERRGSSSKSGSFERRGSSSNSGSFERRYDSVDDDRYKRRFDDADSGAFSERTSQPLTRSPRISAYGRPQINVIPLIIALVLILLIAGVFVYKQYIAGDGAARQTPAIAYAQALESISAQQ